MAAMVVAVSLIILVISTVNLKREAATPVRNIHDKVFIILIALIIPILAVLILLQDRDTVLPKAEVGIDHGHLNTVLQEVVAEGMVIIIDPTIIVPVDTDAMMIAVGINKTEHLTEARIISRSKKIKSRSNQKHE